MDSKNELDRFRAKSDSRRPLVALLEDAGLELWQAPEGFWAIRAKPVAAPTPKPWRRRRARTVS